MNDVDVFIHMAEIAGVLVGFGALIAIRSGPVRELSDIRWVVTTGIWVVITALCPIIVSRYGVTGRELWLAEGVFALAAFVVMLVVNGRAPELASDRAEVYSTLPIGKVVMWAGPTIWLPMLLLVLALAVVVLGLFPDREEAVYLTALGLGLYMGAMGLFATVFWPKEAQQTQSGDPSA